MWRRGAFQQMSDLAKKVMAQNTALLSDLEMALRENRTLRSAIRLEPARRRFYEACLPGVGMDRASEYQGRLINWVETGDPTRGVTDGR
jgi:hypothetical protein